MASSKRYRVEIKRSAAKEIEGIDSRRDRKRIVERISTLSEDPRPPSGTKLSGSDHFRIRQGNYRIVYRVEDERLIVTVVRIGHRRDVYR